MTNKRSLVRVQCDGQLLRQVLGMPEGTVFLNARAGDRLGDVEFTLSNPALPEVLEGEVIPLAVPIFQCSTQEGMRVVELISWGLQAPQTTAAADL
jgi:hypothetical protein